MAAPLLAIENLRVVFHGDRGRRTVAVDGVELRSRAARPRAGRRIRLRQERDLARHDGPVAEGERRSIRRA